jgi:ankyrin repeat protein
VRFIRSSFVAVAMGLATVCAAAPPTVPFPVVEGPFMSREDALKYLARNQIGLDPENLIAAALSGNAQTAEALLSAGVDPNSKGELPQSALQLAALGCAGDRVKPEKVTQTIDVLVRHGARVNDPGMGGLTALFVSVQNCPADVVRRLVKAGADLNSRTPQGYTPLSMALIVENYDAAEVLIDSGARLSAEAATRLLDGENKNTRLLKLVSRARGK